MANIVVLDASSTYCSVSLLTTSGCSHLVELQPRRHAQRLLPMVDEILAAANVSRRQLDGIAFGRGPGSFTGIRIATSVAQGIALGLDIPVYGFSTLQIVAQQALQQQDAACVMAIMDAHMGEVFWGRFDNQAGLAVASSAEQVGAPSLCHQDLQSFRGLLAGNGLSIAGVLDDATRASCSVVTGDCEPLSEFAIPVVQQAWESGEFAGCDQYSPVYLRDSVAWKKLDEQPSLLKR